MTASRQLKLKWLYCAAHLAIHRVEVDGSCWCGVIEDHKPGRGPQALLLDAQTYEEAKAEVRVRCAWLELGRDMRPESPWPRRS